MSALLAAILAALSPWQDVAAAFVYAIALAGYALISGRHKSPYDISE